MVTNIASKNVSTAPHTTIYLLLRISCHLSNFALFVNLLLYLIFLISYIHCFHCKVKEQFFMAKIDLILSLRTEDVYFSSLRKLDLPAFSTELFTKNVQWERRIWVI